jgi:hypothetical protein
MPGDANYWAVASKYIMPFTRYKRKMVATQKVEGKEIELGLDPLGKPKGNRYLKSIIFHETFLFYQYCIYNRNTERLLRFI